MYSPVPSALCRFTEGEESVLVSVNVPGRTPQRLQLCATGTSRLTPGDHAMLQDVTCGVMYGSVACVVTCVTVLVWARPFRCPP